MYRFLETIPGILSWSAIILIVILSWRAPAVVSIFIILFDSYWFFRTVYLALHLRTNFSKMMNYLKIDWVKKLEEETTQKFYLDDKGEKKEFNRTDWKNIYHLVILPMYKEPYEVIQESFDSLAKIDYPKNKLIVVLGTEERARKVLNPKTEDDYEARERTEETIKKIQREFGDKFFKFLVTIHPMNLTREIPGKASNETWAAKEAKKEIDRLKIPYRDIIASVFDVDTQVPPGYFSRLTYVYLTAQYPQKSSYQPIPLFINNVYESPALGRVISFSSSFWQMVQQSQPEHLITFSSHSMPFKALVEIGFWDTNIVSEDSQIFWKCYLHYDGDWRTVSLFYPVSMDINVAPTFWKTIANHYKQQRRWAWGAENIPYLLNGFIKNKKIPFWKKVYWSLFLIEGHFSWATNALMIFSLGWLPLTLGGANFNFSLLAYNLPKLTSWIMTFAMVGIATSTIMSILILPPKPKWFKKWHYLLYALQWFLTPVTVIIFGAIPAMEAQTRLLLGGKFRLGFWVTPKQR